MAMIFQLHRDGTMSVRSYSERYTKKRSMIIFDTAIEESGHRKNSIKKHLPRYGWIAHCDRYSTYWTHPQEERS